MRRSLGNLWTWLGHLSIVGFFIGLLPLQAWIASALAFASGFVVEWITDNAVFIYYGFWCVGLIIVTAKWDAIVARWKRRPAQREIKKLSREFERSLDERKRDSLKMGIAFNRLLTPSKWGQKQEGGTNEKRKEVD